MRSLSCGERAILQQDGPEEVVGDRILSWRTLTARTWHACEECPYGGGIAPGDRYDQLVGLDEWTGAFFIRRLCRSSACDDRRDAERRAAEAARPRRVCLTKFNDDHIPF